MAQRHPTFSIVVPTHSRPTQLGVCLESLAALNYPRDRFEVIVVDDGSRTVPEAVVDPFRGRLDVSLLTQPNSGPAAARNTGAGRAKGEYLAFTDDDCTPAPEWLSTLAARFALTPDHMVGGRILNLLTENAYSAASQLIITYLYAYYNAHPNHARFFTSNNIALPTGRFHAIGGFDTSYTCWTSEDRELCDRWLYHGRRMVYAPEVLVYHAHLLTLRSFWWQHHDYGRGAFCFHQARAQRGRGRVRLEPARFYLNLLRCPFSQSQEGQKLQVTALMALSQVAHTTGYVRERMRGPERR